MDTVPASRRSLRRVGAAALSAAALIGSLVAFPAAADAATSTVVRGTVTIGGHAAAGVPVGTWNPTRGVLATATTDAHGRFTIHSPSGVSVVAYAGAKPSVAKAVSTVGTEHVVRGVIGASAPKALADPLQQRVTRALPSRLGGGHALRFRLEEAGRFTASTPELGAFVDTTGEIGIEHGNGYYGPRFVASAAGDVTSGWLVPGRYHLEWNGKSGIARSWLTVEAGRTVSAPAPSWSTAPHAVISIHVTSGGAPVGAGVPAVQLVGTGTSSSASSDTTGTIVENGFGPGTYRFAVGRYFDDPDEGLEGPPTSDDYLTRTVTVHVPAGTSTVSATVDLAPASKATGTFVAPVGTSAAVYVENAAGDVVRNGSVDSGAVTIAGLPAGTYRVFGVDLDRHRYDVETITLPTATSTASAPTPLARPLEPKTAEPTVHGTVTGVTQGYVAVRSKPVDGAVLYAAFTRTLTAHATTYSLRTIPGHLRLVVLDEHHLDRTYAYGSVTASARRNVGAGVRFGTVVARFAVHGHIVRVDVEATGSGDRVVDLARASGGRSVEHGVTPGRYTWSHAFEPLPASDGPWYYTAPKGSFTVHAGTVAHLGTKVITIRS